MSKKCVLGLLGYPLGHSFSPSYFADKFKKLGLEDWEYRLLELPELEKLKDIIISGEKDWLGFNVTIPYKQSILAHLDSLDSLALRIGAVNVVKIQSDGKWRGYNTDYFGFLHTLLQIRSWHSWKGCRALIFGNGGSSLAVAAVLKDLEVSFQKVTRNPADDGNSAIISYQQLELKDMQQADLLVQTTPVGMEPIKDATIPVPPAGFSSGQFVIDLIYNPAQTRFLQLAASRGAVVHNGLPMLQAQAEKSWEIWNS